MDSQEFAHRPMSANRRNRIVIEASRPRHQFRNVKPRPRESVVAVTVIIAATLATFVALFITSRPYDPMNSTDDPKQNVPPGQVLMQPSPKPSSTTTPSPQSPVSGQATESTGETAKPIVVHDATIQAEIERVMEADPVLSKLDVSTLVESG